MDAASMSIEDEDTEDMNDTAVSISLWSVGWANFV